MKEIVVISGKGGTGKTSIAASFAALAEGCAVIADCDVDAADLHLVLSPSVVRREEFRSGNEAVIRQDACIRCGACLDNCRFEAVRKMSAAEAAAFSAGRSCEECDTCRRSCSARSARDVLAMQEAVGLSGAGAYAVDPLACEGCGVCVRVCPVAAIDFPERVAGEWFVSDTRHGPLVHARLTPGAENSGKLVTRIRKEAAALADARALPLVIADGSPGIGCPVIASLTGAALALVIAEPTVSGAHDAGRALGLAKRLGVPAAICVNKRDLNEEVAGRIEGAAGAAGAAVLPGVPYDADVTKAQVEGKTLVESSDGPAASQVKRLWREVLRLTDAGTRRSTMDEHQQEGCIQA